jgi:hypothetical protein
MFYLHWLHFIAATCVVICLVLSSGILIKYVCYWNTPVSIPQSSRLQIQRSGFDFRRYHVSWEAAGLELGPLSLVSTIEELRERKSSGSGLESLEYGREDPSRWPRDILYQQKFALTSPTSGGNSAGTVRSRTQATEILLVLNLSSLIIRLILLKYRILYIKILPTFLVVTNITCCFRVLQVVFIFWRSLLFLYPEVKWRVLFSILQLFVLILSTYMLSAAVARSV